MTQGKQGSGDAPVPALPTKKAEPVPAGNSYFERLAAPLPREQDPAVPGKFLDSETLSEREARRLSARLPEGYKPTSGADLTFDPRIAYEIALGLASPSEVFQRYGVTERRARELIANPVFVSTITKYKEEVAEGGISFRLKAKIQAEDLLSHSYILATDPEVPAAVRADLIKWTAKMANLEPDTKNKGEGGGGAGFTLNITFAGEPAPARIINADITTTPVEDAQLVEDKQ